nr:MAG TPA: hypothetical protein [Caudoviricetes sp.]
MKRTPRVLSTGREQGRFSSKTDDLCLYYNHLEEIIGFCCF